jgi:ribosomal-protein-alanine N-acetyltransferase
MDIKIERATIQDLNEIEKIEANLEHGILSSSALSSTLNKNTYYYSVAKFDGAVVGYLSAEFLVDHFDLLAIAVEKDFRRQNVATYLLDKLYNLCSELKINDIFLEVRQTNLSAVSFYEKVGFEKISTRKNYYTDTNEDAYIYKKVV